MKKLKDELHDLQKIVKELQAKDKGNTIESTEKKETDKKKTQSMKGTLKNKKKL